MRSQKLSNYFKIFLHRYSCWGSYKYPLLAQISLKTAIHSRQSAKHSSTLLRNNRTREKITEVTEKQQRKQSFSVLVHRSHDLPSRYTRNEQHGIVIAKSQLVSSVEWTSRRDLQANGKRSSPVRQLRNLI